MVHFVWYFLLNSLILSQYRQSSVDWTISMLYLTVMSSNTRTRTVGYWCCC